MYYVNSAEKRELCLVSEHNYENYSLIKPMFECIDKHIKKGQFNYENAVNGLYNKLYYISKNYERDFGYMFSVTERFSASITLLENYLADNYNDIFQSLDYSHRYFEFKHGYGQNVGTKGGACDD